MERDNLTYIVPEGSHTMIPDINTTTEIVEEGPRICPLCSSEVRFFFIHFNDKMLMCENTDCEFPFGHEALQFMTVEGSDAAEVSTIRTRSRFSPTPTGSVISTAAWSEIDKINRECEDTQDRFYEDFNKQNRVKKNANENVEKIKQGVEEIRALSQEIHELREPKKIIKNRKLIENLLYFQGVSGTQLVKPQEMDQIKSPDSENRELKINIQPGTDNTMSSITIDISDKKC